MAEAKTGETQKVSAQGPQKAQKVSEKEKKELERELRDLMAEPVYVTVGKKVFTVRPVPMGEIPRLGKMIDKIGDVDLGNVAGMSMGQLKLMAEIIYEAIKQDHPVVTPSVILKHVSLTSFPDFMMAVMDLNGFFAKMGDMGRLAAGQQMLLGFPNISNEPPDLGKD